MLTPSSSSCACVESDNSNLPAEKGSTIYQLLTSPDKVDIEHLSVEHFQVEITSSLLQHDVITQMCCRDALHWSVVSDIEEFYAIDGFIIFLSSARHASHPALSDGSDGDREEIGGSDDDDDVSIATDGAKR